MQQQQKEGDYLETDIERIKNQLNHLKNDIKHVNEKIRVDSSESNNIEWDTLLCIV
jgi:septation ring formation regulator EzrA